MKTYSDLRISDPIAAVTIVALIATVLVGATATPARAQTTERVSVASDGTQGGLPAADSFVSLSGVNLPWINYGHDVGLAHTWEASHDGFSSNVTRLRADLEFAANHRVKLVRLFIFCDLRGGIVFDDAGVPQSFDEYVHADFQTLLDEASRLGLRLIPVLFDYTLADGVTTEVTVGEHPQLITDPARRDELLAILRPFLAQYGSDPTIYAWDVVSEPKYATACEMVAMRGFVVEVADLIREVAPEARVTLGCGDRGELPQWTDVGLDLYQFHYYDWMEPTTLSTFRPPISVSTGPSITASRQRQTGWDRRHPFVQKA